MFCPQNAVFETERPIGKIVKGVSGDVSVISGILNTGEESGVPIIRTMLKDVKSNSQALTVIDCPPGSACVVMESIRTTRQCSLSVHAGIRGEAMRVNH